MPVKVVQTHAHDEQESLEAALGRPARELMSYRLRCARTANGLSHYYMYGDLAPERTVL